MSRVPSTSTAAQLLPSTYSTASQRGSNLTVASAGFGNEDDTLSGLKVFKSSHKGQQIAAESYNRCVNICSDALARGDMDVLTFFNKDGKRLKKAFGLRKMLLQPNISTSNEAAAPKLDKITGQLTLRVVEVRTATDLDLAPKSKCFVFSNLGSKLSSLWQHAEPSEPANARCSSELYRCFLRLKGSTKEGAIPMGSDQIQVFIPESMKVDCLTIEVQDSQGTSFGLAEVPLAHVLDNRLWRIYREDNEYVADLQLHATYSTIFDPIDGSSVREIDIYDAVLTAALKDLKAQRGNLILNGPWKFILRRCASYGQFSFLYTKIRYIAYVMDVATPTADCLNIMCELLVNGGNKITLELKYGEEAIAGDITKRITKALKGIFSNYKSLDELSISGFTEVIRDASELVQPALLSAVRLYDILYDISRHETQNDLKAMFKFAMEERFKILLEYTNGEVARKTNDGTSVQQAAYEMMAKLCQKVGNEIIADSNITKKNILLSSLNLAEESSTFFSYKLRNELNDFIAANPPSDLSKHVAKLVIATANFEKDLAAMNLRPDSCGLNAKKLFDPYIKKWIAEIQISMSVAYRKQEISAFPVDLEMLKKKVCENFDVITERWAEYKSMIDSLCNY